MSLNHATVILNSIRNDTLVKNTDEIIGHSIKKFYIHKVHYELGSSNYVDTSMKEIQNIRDLINQSTNCRQYIRFDCRKSYLLKNLDKTKHRHMVGARWWSHDWTIMDYWGGSSEEKKTCKCGIDNTCARKYFFQFMQDLLYESTYYELNILRTSCIMGSPKICL